MDELTRGWLAGLLEGEGCFHMERNRYPRISLQMTDRDVVEKAQSVCGASAVRGPYNVHGPYHKGDGCKPAWRLLISRREDVERILLSIYPLMGERRQAKIQLCLNYVPPPRPVRTKCKLRGHELTDDNVYVSPGGHRFCIACYVMHYGYRPKKASPSATSPHPVHA